MKPEINRTGEKMVKPGIFLLLSICGLMLVMPMLVYWPLNAAPVAGIIPVYISPALYLTDFLVLLIILLRLLAWRGIPQPIKNAFSDRSFLWSFFPLAAIVLLGLIDAGFALSPALAIYTALRWLMALGLYLTLLCTPLPTEKVVLIFLLGLGVQAVIGLGQFLMRSPLGIPGELALPVSVPGSAALSFNGMRWLRAYGLTFHPNVLGGFLGVGLILGLPMLPRRWLTPLWWLLAIGLLTTLSRSAGIFAALVIPLAAVWLARRQPALRRQLLIAFGGLLGAGLIGILALGGVLLHRASPLKSMAELTSLSGRGELIRLALKATDERPVIGIGAGNFPIYVSRSDSPAIRHPVHNIPLLLAAEIGLPGGILWYILWLAPPFMLVGRWRRLSLWAIPFTAAWFFLGLIGLWDFYPWGLESGRLLSVFVLAVCHKEMFTNSGD